MMENIKYLQYPKPKTSVSFILIVMLLTFSNVFCLSGAAELLCFNDTLCNLFVLFFCFLLANKKKIDVLGAKYLWFLLSVMLILMAVIMKYEANKKQIINLVSTFGCILYVQLFSLFRWEQKNFVSLGIPCSLFGVALTWLFLPGHALSGWNSNSSILAISIVLLGMSFLWTSPKKNGTSCYM